MCLCRRPSPTTTRRSSLRSSTPWWMKTSSTRCRQTSAVCLGQTRGLTWVVLEWLGSTLRMGCCTLGIISLTASSHLGMILTPLTCRCWRCGSGLAAKPGCSASVRALLVCLSATGSWQMTWGLRM
jgi:hypothetical protein